MLRGAPFGGRERIPAGDRTQPELCHCSPLALLLLGWHVQEGLDQIQQALRLDPVSPNINGMLGDYLMETRQFEKGVEQLRKTAELDPQQYNSRIRLGFAYAVVHRYAEARE